jgi:hypothetical protein
VTDQPSRQTLDEIPNRVLTFLLGVAKYTVVRAALAAKGYTQAEHDSAWKLLMKLGVYPVAAGTPDKEVRDAVVELDAWDEPNFAIIRAALERLHPVFVEDVFKNLEPKQGAEAVVSVSTLLDRLDGIEKDPSPNAQAVIATLDVRGYPKAERKRLRELTKKAKSFAAAPVTSTEREQILLDLYAWHRDWSTTARQLIQKRVHLIALGLASKRKPEKKADKPATEPAGESGPAGSGAGGAGGPTG